MRLPSYSARVRMSESVGKAYAYVRAGSVVLVGAATGPVTSGTMCVENASQRYHSPLAAKASEPNVALENREGRWR
jgi:hypothetical protein